MKPSSSNRTRRPNLHISMEPDDVVPLKMCYAESRATSNTASALVKSAEKGGGTAVRAVSFADCLVEEMEVTPKGDCDKTPSRDKPSMVTDPNSGFQRRRIVHFADEKHMAAYTAANLKRSQNNTALAYESAREEAEEEAEAKGVKCNFDAPALDTPYEISLGTESRRSDVAFGLCVLLGILIGSAIIIAFEAGLLDGSTT